MTDLIAGLGGRVVDAGLAATTISGLAMLAMLATRQPSRRQAIARAGMLGVLLAMPLVTLRPVGPFDIVAPIRQAIGPASDWIGGRLGLGQAGTAGSLRWIGATAGLVRSFGPWLLAAYGLGVAAGLARLAIGGLGSGWIVGRSTEPGPEVVTLYGSLPFLSSQRRPRLRVSAMTRPVLLGIIRPTILIPRALVEPGAGDELRLAMLHELAHAEASDPGFALISELASAFWFFVPPLWWVRRQLRLDGEFLADRHAAHAFGASRRYAAALVEVAASPNSAPVTATTSGPGVGSALFQRVLMLLRCPFPVENRPPTWWTGGLLAVAVVVVTGLAGLTVGSGVSLTEAPEESTPDLISIARLILDDAGMPEPTLLPVRVPGRFTLDFEVYARSAELSEVRVMGFPLGSPTPEPDSFLDDPPRWHRVRLIRGDSRLTLVLDNARPIQIEPAAPGDAISLRSVPGRATTFRSIRIHDNS